MISTGFVLLDDRERLWQELIRFGALNRGGIADSHNSLTPTRQDVASLDLPVAGFSHTV